MAPNPVEPLDSLGQRLTRQAARLMRAHTPEFAWMAPAQELLAHLASLCGPAAHRFERIEAEGAPTVLGDRFVPSGNAIDGDGEVSAGRALPSDVQARLHRAIGVDAAAMRVHDDAAADAIARAHRADAVSVGQHVYFRQGRFAPRDPSGFGLLAHEATHVAELIAPGGPWRRLTGAGRLREEHLARANERLGSLETRSDIAATRAPAQHLMVSQAGWIGPVAVAPRQGQPLPASPAAPSGEAPAGGQPAVPAAVQPMAAGEDRDAAPLPPLDLDALRRSLFQDLKRQLQTEFERGA
jgi:hypothetical protein